MKKTKYYLIASLISFLLITGCANQSYKNPDNFIDKRVENLIKRMSLEEKIGQLMQVDSSFLKNINDIVEYNIGSILYGGDTDPGSKDPQSWLDLNNIYQKAAQKTKHSIPLLIGIDAVHGLAKVNGATIFPHNIGMGCTNNPELVQKTAEITAKEMRALGFNWAFAPCIAVVQDERWGRTYESFGENTDLVSRMGKSAIFGFQSEKISKASVLACAKHYVGDGGTVNGIDQGNTQIDEKTLRKIHLKPYISAIKANTGSIMISFSSWNNKKMHGNKYLITDVLRNELRFEGLIVTDWAGYKYLEGNLEDKIIQSFDAGIDMYMIPDIYEEFYKTMLSLVKDKKISIERINQSVNRLLKIKFMLGLFENPITKSDIKDIGSETHKKTAKQAVKESTVLLKNNGILPLTHKIKHIHVVGKNADNLGFQCGGWTLSWQGLSGDITEGITILEGIKKIAPTNTKVTFSENGEINKNADLIIAVVGETPYAEMFGDRKNLELILQDKNALKKIKKANIPVITILITGRPLIIDKEINSFDALLISWLPGTEGDGIAEILFGKYNPKAKLSITWPKTMNQIPINENYNSPLFPYGYGLEY